MWKCSPQLHREDGGRLDVGNHGVVDDGWHGGWRRLKSGARLVRTQGGERLMGTTAYGEEGPREGEGMAIGQSAPLAVDKNNTPWQHDKPPLPILRIGRCAPSTTSSIKPTVYDAHLSFFSENNELC